MVIAYKYFLILYFAVQVKANMTTTLPSTTTAHHDNDKTVVVSTIVAAIVIIGGAAIGFCIYKKIKHRFFPQAANPHVYYSSAAHD